MFVFCVEEIIYLLLLNSHDCTFKEWCIDAGIIAPGSVAQATEMHHYYRCMHLQRMFRYTDTIAIWQNEKLSTFFKVLEEHKLALWVYTFKFETCYEVEIIYNI